MPAATLVPVTPLLEQAADFAGRVERLIREAFTAAAERDQLQTEPVARQATSTVQVGPGAPETAVQVPRADLTDRNRRPWWQFWRRKLGDAATQ